jgi:hypothetical protein
MKSPGCAASVRQREDATMYDARPILGPKDTPYLEGRAFDENGTECVPPMALIEAVREFEDGRFVMDGCPGSLSQTGEEYTEIVNGDAVSEDGPRIFYPSAEGAIQAWLTGIVKWAEDKPGTIYWSERPSLEKHPDGCSWKVYSRLLISDKPIVTPTVTETQ